MEQANYAAHFVGKTARPLRAIVLDDNPMVLAVLAEALRGIGLTVSAVDNANDALHEMGEPPTPALLITDIDLGPGPDGFDVAEHARIRWPNLPIFIVSGSYNGDPELDTALSLRSFRKPIRIATLLQAIAESLPPH